MSGLDEAVIKNVEACKQLSKTRTSLGPPASTLPRTQIWLPNEQTPRSRSTFATPRFFAKRKVVIVANAAHRYDR